MAMVSKITFKGENSTNLLDKMKSNQKNTQSGVNIYTKTETPSKNTTKDYTTTTKPDKTLTYVSSAVALAALGVTTYVAVKNGKLSRALGEVSHELADTKQHLTDSIHHGLSEADRKIQELGRWQDGQVEGVAKKVEEAEQHIKDLGKWQDGQIEGAKQELSTKIDSLSGAVKAAGAQEILTEPVNVNGLEMQLAKVMHGYGKNQGSLEKELRSESTKRIFGIVDRSKITPPDEIMVRVPTSEFKGFSSTGGMSIVPREVVANLGAIINSKQKAKIVVDTPLYLGQVEDKVYYSIVKQADGTYNYVSSKMDKPMAKLEKIDTMKLPIYTDKGKTNEAVEVYMAKGMEQQVDLKLLVPWLEKDLADEITKAIEKGHPFEINTDILRVKFKPEQGMTKPVATVKYDAVFYKHDKFRMDGPVVDGAAKNIYNNLTHEAGETERFIYFDKFFYEHLLRNAESSDVPLRADLIIGNDWQTGGISAMTRLLTTAKKYFGLDPKVAEKIYNTPIMTIMHNAGLSGDSWHSQPKLLNIMFGEHAAVIAKNAWMPKNANLNADSLNGLFHGTNLNPQTMAAAYSDVITPVSKGYGHEMASHSGFGGGNHDIYRMRARYNEFGDIEHIKYLARQNDLDYTKVPQDNISYKPITNSCDRVNNTLTEQLARKIEYNLGLEKGALKTFDGKTPVIDVHNHNKEVYLNKVISDINLARNKKANPMNIELPELTNLEGVNKDTMVVSTAGRIVDQKGLDIFAEAIDEILTRHHDETNLPVFYAQGVGDKVYIDKMLEIKNRIKDKFGEKAAERIVFAKLFSEPGRYDGCKLMSDFTVMSSWFEPCGLVHKEIAAFSGSIPIVNKVGGLTDGLTDGVNAIFADFKPKFENYNDAIDFNRKAFADAIERAMTLFRDKPKFAQVLTNSFELDHSWLRPTGAIKEYVKTFVDLKVLKPEILDYAQKAQ